MDPQKKFLAATLQGAMDAEVISREDVFRHMTAAVLATHVPSEILWECLLEGMAEAGIGPGAATGPKTPMPASPSFPKKPFAPEGGGKAAGAKEPAKKGATPSEGAVGGGSIDIDVTDALDDLPPLPDDEELAVEEVDWEGEDK